MSDDRNHHGQALPRPRWAKFAIASVVAAVLLGAVGRAAYAMYDHPSASLDMLSGLVLFVLVTLVPLCVGHARRALRGE